MCKKFPVGAAELLVFTHVEVKTIFDHIRRVFDPTTTIHRFPLSIETREKHPPDDQRCSTLGFTMVLCRDSHVSQKAQVIQNKIVVANMSPNILN